MTAHTAVFFDFSETLAHDVPRQEDLLAAAAGEFGLALTPAAARRGLDEAGHFWTAAMAERSLGARSPQDQRALFEEFDTRVLAAAGAPAPGPLALRVFQRLLALSRSQGHRLALFDDALPALEALRAAGFRRGIISNLDRSIHAICRDLGLAAAVEVIVGAGDAGAAKPDPAIFRLAVQRMGVDAVQAFYVGDQMVQDIGGAAAAGLRPILLDRYDLHPDYAGPRLTTLAELPPLVRYLNTPPF